MSIEVSDMDTPVGWSLRFWLPLETCEHHDVEVRSDLQDPQLVKPLTIHIEVDFDHGIRWLRGNVVPVVRGLTLPTTDYPF